MRIYVIGVPHTQTSPRFSTCAFTMKAWNLCRMLTDLGHHVVHLGNGGSHPTCAENVALIEENRFEKVCGHPGTDNYRLLGGNGEHGAYLRDWSNNLERELMKRIGMPWTEIVCSVWGADDAIALRNIATKQFVVESGIGYRYTFAKYRVFESYAWMHFHWGMERRFAGNGWTEVVIPNAFDPEMFKFQEKRDDYILFMGRLNEDKGVGLAIDVAREIGSRIVIAGQGDPRPYLKNNPHASYVAPVGPADRSELMGRARVLMCPTFYTEMFGGVAVEAQMCGTPVISTDWGAFPETVLHGHTGYRCRTREQFVWAAKNVGGIAPLACRRWAEDNFGLAKVKSMYDEYFQQIANLARSGWNEPNAHRTSLGWLTKSFPPSVRGDDAKPCDSAVATPRGEIAAHANAAAGRGAITSLSFFFQCYKHERAAEAMLQSVRQYYPSSTIIMISDGGDDLSGLAGRYGCAYSAGRRLGDGRTTKFRDKEGAEEWLRRLDRACEASSEEWIMILEDDVLIRGLVAAPPTDAAGPGRQAWSRLSDEMVAYLRSRSRSAIDWYGCCGGSIIRRLSLRDAIARFIANEDYNYLMLLDTRMSYQDVLTTVALILAGYTYGEWDSFCQTTPGWQNNGKAVVHDYKDNYDDGETRSEL